MSARGLRASLRFILCAGVVLVLVCAGCGSRRAVPPIQPADDISLHETLAELEGMECPEGVDEALWAELKAALAEALKDSCRAGIHPRRSTTGMKDGGHKWPPYSDSSADGDGHSMLCPYKSVATPPTGDANKVTDLAILDNGDGTFTLSWHYRNLGDYDQNGTVGIEDITPLAQHYNEEVPGDDAERNSLQAVIDGSGSGRIGIEDITPIAMYFGTEVAEYEIEGAASAEGEFSEIGEVSIASATGKDTGRAEFAYALTPGENGYFRVVPRDGEGASGDASNVVGLALEVLSVAPLEVKEGTVVTFTAEVTGAGPIEYAWDFGGQAVPPTSTEAEPEVVLTREVGEFSASLTVSNPQGDVTYPFTLTKLAREWKYEVIYSNPEGGPVAGDLLEYDGELWFYLYDDSNPPGRYLVHGIPGDWVFEETPLALGGTLDLSSSGRPGFAGQFGPFLDKALTFIEWTPEGWQETELEYSRIFGRTGFVYAANDEPFITFSLPDAPDSRFIEYFWRKGGEWERGIVDEPHSKYRPSYCMTADPDGNPVICYNAYKYNEFSECRIAWWNEDSYQWEFLIVEDYNVWYAAVDFNKDGRLGVTYSDNYEAEPDTYCDRLIYAVYDGASWEKEVVDERLDEPGQSYEAKTLAHDPHGNAAIAYSYAHDHDRDIIVEWFDGSEWRDYVIDEDYRPSILIATDGTGYVLTGNSDRKEVMLARYE